ncbi:MAG TPA: D-alanyl-D-alanine carboxypeptidase/D-alanyl-D-alanine-endopeptidase [Gemmatimonadales bacterium]|nr:D-alanyl-D-alanine carboxypeptidase/D-alanyl-D-alanine-endopeptidase [Gemmatimonadales bacterium]
MPRRIRGWRTIDRAARAGRILLALVALLPASTPLAAQRDLARRLDARLDAPPFDRLLWGVAVLDERGRLLYGRNHDKLFMPASNTKLVVSAVAAALLPPDFTVRTSLYGAGPIVDGVLHGDLVLYGRGDPTFGRRCFAVDTLLPGVCDRDPAARLRELGEALRARGIRTVAGDLVGDGSYFEPETVHPAWSYFDLNWWYAAPVSGLGFNDNSVDFHWRPGAGVGAPALITMEPDLGDIAFENRTVTLPAGGVTDLPDRFYRTPGTLSVWAEGTVALDSRGGTESFVHPDPNLYTARALRQALAEAGIAVAGATRSTTDSMRYRHVRAGPPLAEVTSRPVRDWIFPILNTSQNWYAEMLLKQLGRLFGTAGSWQEGLAVERRFLIDSVGIDSTHFALSDGSGLSADNLVSPLAFTRLLQYMRRHPRYAVFAAGLPRSGTVGSLRNRFRGTPLEGRVVAKTGSISRVNTLSGYVERPDGRVLTFSIQANHHTLPGRVILARIDSVVAELGR